MCFFLVAYNADYFSALWTTAQQNDLHCCLQRGKMVSIVSKNVEKCLNLIISMNLKTNANLPGGVGFNQRPRLMCFMKTS